MDFSDALFVCTANDESTIPGPLKDRMEVIRLTGYDIPEKVAIGRRYLVPKALKEAGFEVSDESIYILHSSVLVGLMVGCVVCCRCYPQARRQ